MITAIIPARGGSKNIPRKNIVDLNGHPLVAYSIAACKLCKDIDRIIVSTEDKEIAEISKQYGAEVPFMRPSKYSTNESTDVGFLTHFFENINVDSVALIRPTSPFRDPKFMSMAIKRYYTIQDTTFITGFRTISEVHENPYKAFKNFNHLITDPRQRHFFKLNNFNIKGLTKELLTTIK